MEEKDSAFKKEVARESKVVSKQVKNIASKTKGKVKEFSDKDFGKFKGLHIILAVIIVVLLVLCVSCLGKDKGIEYPLVYVTSDGDVKVLTSNSSADDSVKISNDGGIDAEYSNTSSRYVLYSKNDNLYLFDAKDLDEQEKILSDVESYSFSTEDSYIIAMNEDHDLYTIVPGKEKEKLDKDITGILGFTDEKIMYDKDDNLYIRSLKSSKNDRVKVTDSYDAAYLSEDNKYITFTKDGTLYLYNISKDKKEVVAKDVDDFLCGEESCENIMYTKLEDGKYDVYHYNGKKSDKIAKSIQSVEDINVDENYILYTTDDNVLYFKHGTKDAYKVSKEVNDAGFIFGGESIIYMNEDDELFIAKVKGNKIGSSKKIGEDIANIVEMDNKIAFVSDIDDNSCGDLYIATNSRSKKVDTDVYYNLQVNNDGDKIYYLKNYEDYSGDLYYTKGSSTTKIDSDVYYSYQYIKDDLIYYIKDYSTTKYRGDLYRYTGKSTKVEESVKSIDRSANTGYEYSE